ncbi:MAG: hypothetical protein QHH27_10945 [Clostridia bacterium]|jgi:Arc/MetJ-type ribon-helix-helix transcriptional regulator|nr:ribbon-helix-helix domain-containing protein [Clostridia bacterium]MDH7574039.1 hypothetical protein [Clostridia bacterium]
MTAVRLPVRVIKEIDGLVGKGNRSKFIAGAIEKELRRQKRLAYLRSNQGLVSDEEIPDAVDFVNRLRGED